MGDRRNVQFKMQPADVFLYTHWGGSELPQTVAQALKRGERRWNDESYLCRIVFSQMIASEVMDETGYGISSWPAGDAEYPPVVVDCDKQMVSVGGMSWTFPQFVEKFGKED